MTEESKLAAEDSAATHAPLAAGDNTADAAESDAPPSDPNARSFSEMNLEPTILAALEEMGYAKPMPVQSAVYDRIVAGRDVMVQARTGTGKTAAFGIPIGQMLSPEDMGVQALILAPTRELALQVSLEVGSITRNKGLHVVPVYGGAPMGKQIDALKKGAQIVAGTPGRVLDHIRRKTFITSGVKLLVLDECDEMLSMGFLEEIEAIISTLPDKTNRQTMLFSATLPPEIDRIAKRHTNDAERVSLSDDGVGIGAADVDHYYYVVSGMARTRDLSKVLEVEDPTTAIIFCNTREDTSLVAAYLARHGYDAEAISSDLSQRDRERVMGRMRQKHLRFLVATDVAARGIDISDLSHVINYTFPESPEVYVHRTGRTGRAGNKGRAISLVGPREIGSFYYLKLLYKILPQERQLPSGPEIATVREGHRLQQVLARVGGEEPSAELKALARRLWQSPDGERVVGLLLQQLLERPRATAAAAATADVETPAAEAVGEIETGERERERNRGRSRGRGPRRERDARSDRDQDERRPRRRRRRREGEEDREASAGPDAPLEQLTAAETDAERGDRPRRRRRRRDQEREAGAGDASADAAVAEQADREPAEDRGDKRGTSSAGASARGPSSVPAKEFWEAWADEKTVNKAAEPTRARDGDEDDEDEDEDDRDAADNGKSNTVRLYVNLGRREQLSADGLRALLREHLGHDDGDKLGRAQVRNTHSYIRVAADVADAVIAAVEGKSYKDRDIVIEYAKR